MNLLNDVTKIIVDVLVLEDRADSLNENTALLGALPEFDSVAAVSLTTALEQEFGCSFDDDELNADVFATIGSLTKVTEQKLA